MKIIGLRILTLILLLGFSISNYQASANEGFRVVASIKPVHSILAALMEGITPPELLISGNKTPYDFQPDERQLAGLADARMVVWVGPELESTLVSTIGEIDSKTHVVTLLDNPNLKILDSRWNDEARDPYFWLDSRNGLILIDELTAALISIDPGRSHLYKRNRNQVNNRLGDLDRKLEYGYRGLKRGLALSYYDTLQYFEQAYALKIGNALTESPYTPVAGGPLLEERKKLAQGGYACLLLENSLRMPNLDLLTSGVEIETGQLDSLGVGFSPGPDLYFELMERNTAEIKACFERAISDETYSAETEETVPPEEMGGRFILIDQNNNPFTNKDMLGKYSLVFFGYTSCPDICPTSMVVATQALKQLGDLAGKLQTYFISIDPTRDTPEKLNTYIGYFNDSIIGLTGSETMIAKTARSYNAKYEKVIEEGAGPDDFYIMDHTASFFLMSPAGKFVTKFPYGTTSVQLAEKLGEYLR